MDIDVIEGSLASLRRVDVSSELVRRFADPELQSVCGIYQVPGLAALQELMDEDESLWIWEIFPEGHPTPVGYALYVTYDGPPYVAIYFFPKPPNFDPSFDLASDCVLHLCHAFFAHTEEDALFFYVDKPVDDTVHDALTEGGFDLFEQCPTIDADVESCYVLERYTYEAYYKDEDEDVY
ncbi:MAG: hypothetical protein R3C68_02265 [Myxococcota bacterium]